VKTRSLWLAALAVALSLTGEAIAQRNLSVAPAAANEQRVALIIGNAAYKEAPLRNPVNDATDMAATLQSLGFAVTLRTNADTRQMRAAIREFAQNLKRGGVGLFYFAGHGVQSRTGKNYLIPVGADLKEEFELEDEAVDANRVLAGMEEAGNRVNIVILDACRNNPFARSWRSAVNGLAQMSAPTGSFVGFATAPGQVAADGSGRNGLYTKHLLENLKAGDPDIDRVFTRVTAAVAKETGNKQVPWKSSSLTGDFYFRLLTGVEQVASVAPSVPSSESVIRLQEQLRETTDDVDKKFSLLARDGWQEAASYFQNALTSKPEEVNIRAGLAVTMIFKGDEESARYQVRRLKEMKSETRWTRIAVGLLDGLGQDYEGGKYQLARAIEDGADRALAYLCLAIIHNKNDRKDLAEKQLEDYKEIVTVAERGSVSKELSEKTNIAMRLIGNYYVTLETKIVNENSARISFRNSGDIIAGVVTQAGPSQNNVKNMKIEKANLSFDWRNQSGSFWVEWTISADLKGDLREIPIRYKVIGSNISASLLQGSRGFLIRKD
jgi:hypothetical protein